IGGVGKTTLVREFAKELIKNPPSGLEKLVWLSAKKQLYIAIQDQYQAASRVDFSDLRTLLVAMLLELGYAENNIDPEWSVRELVDECVQALQTSPSLVIIDDVDSLDLPYQQEVFQTIIRIVTQAGSRGSQTPSLALLTARLELGAAPDQLIRVVGLELPDFSE